MIVGVNCHPWQTYRMRAQTRGEAALDSIDTVYDGWNELQDVCIARGLSI